MHIIISNPFKNVHTHTLKQLGFSLAPEPHLMKAGQLRESWESAKIQLWGKNKFNVCVGP